MDLTLEIDTENQQQTQLKIIRDTTKVSTSKEYLQLLPAGLKPKSDRSGNQVFLYYGINLNDRGFFVITFRYCFHKRQLVFLN